ncbi:MAG: hypothetical protein AAF621_05770 [Pseudomonadota bacterium]
MIAALALFTAIGAVLYFSQAELSHILKTIFFFGVMTIYVLYTIKKKEKQMKKTSDDWQVGDRVVANCQKAASDYMNNSYIIRKISGEDISISFDTCFGSHPSRIVKKEFLTNITEMERAMGRI